MGTPDFSVPILERLIKSEHQVVAVVTQPDRPKGRKRQLAASPVKQAAQAYEIPVYQPEKLSDELDEILAIEADIIITAAYGQLLPEKLLQYPKFGCINVHASLLPELRGGAPIHYAILEGKKETGITIMYMAKKLDAGDIISQEAVTIEADDHVGTLHDKLSRVGANLLETTLPSIFEQQNNRTKQDEAKATFAPNITREQEKIDWHLDHYAIYNHIRGLHPWPVAYTLFEGERMKIWWGERNEHTFSKAKPGEIVAIDDNQHHITVACGDSHGINLTMIQPAGKKRLQMKDFLKGNPNVFQIGQIME